MSLLKLSPGSERLRRITKAYAAGELSEADYRRIRGEVIAGVMRGEPAMPVAFGDETQRRGRLPQTGGRSGWAAAGPVTAEAPVQAPVARKRRRGLAIMAVLTVLILGLAAMISRPLLARTVDIPAVADRDPNSFTSPRLPVSELRIRDLPLFPHLGLDQRAIDGFLSERLAEVRQEAAPDEHGFTEAELDEVARLLDAFGVHAPDATLGPGDASELLALIQAQKARRGLSIVQLEQLAADVGRFYRDHGLPLAVAYVPVQTVDDSIVELAVLPGILAQTRVDSEDFPVRLVERAFARQVGEAVEATEVESVLWRINELPGVRAQGRFVTGPDVGTTVLDLQVEYRDSWDTRFRLDNHGSEATGEGRTLAEARWHNVSGRADGLSAGVMATWQPGNTLYGYLDYRLPWPDIATEVGLRAAVDAFDWSNAGTAFNGSSRSLAFGLRRQLQRGREQSTALDAGITWQHLRLEAAEPAPPLQKQDAYILSLGVNEDRILKSARLADIAVQFRLGLDALRVGGGAAGLESGSVFRLGFEASAWRLVDLFWFDNPETLSVSLGGQVASGALPGTLQMSLGGPTGSRGYAWPTLSADDAIRGRINLRLQPWSQRNLGDLLIFADAVAGEQKREFDSDASAFLASTGIGWEIRFGDWLTSQLVLAWPLFDSSSGTQIDDDGLRVLLQLEYRP